MPSPRANIRLMLLLGASLSLMSPTWAQETESSGDEDVRELQTVVVRGEFIPDEKRSTSEVSSLLDAEDFQLQGDSDAAAALSRLAGVSTADNKFVYVRGLNERYSSALLNGSPLPSPAPLRRVAPLDLFPTSALDSILVQKTFSPNLPGEFGGGLVDIRTKGLPNETFLDVSLGGSLDTITSLQSGLLYDGSDTDALGFDNGDRDLPSLENGFEEFGRNLTDNSSLLVIQNGDVAPNFSGGLTGGTRYDISEDYSVGIIGSLGYSNGWSTREGVRGIGQAVSRDSDEIRVDERRERFSTQNTVNLNGLVSAGVDIFDNHQIGVTGLITRSSEKEARTILGVTVEDAGVFRDDSIEWFERELWTTQIRGEHIFPALMDLEVEWRGSYSEASRDAPYQIATRYRQNDDGTFRLQSSPAANRFLFSEVADDTTDFGIDFTLPIVSGSGDCVYFCDIELKAGYSYVENDREAVNRQFDVTGVNSTISGSGSRLDFIYQFLFNGGGGNVVETGGIIFPEAYLATLEVDAFYGGVDVQVTPYIRAAVGGRFESAIQAVDTLVLGADPDQNFVESCIERQADLSCDLKEDFLPAVTITWNPLNDLQVRAGYSETLTRPQFRELAPTEFVNTETDITFVGNPFLVNAEIKNYDVRAEYYFGRNQFITAGFFYKDMTNPIEETFQVTGNRNVTGFLNVPKAELYGVELEYEQVLPLNRFFNWNILEDGEFTLKTNYTWSDSEIDGSGTTIVNSTPISPSPTEVIASTRIRDGRRLQGQSEHLVNLQFGYTNDADDFEANLLFNYASERIRTAENLQDFLPAILEEVPARFDLVVNKGFELQGGQYEFSLNIENLLGSDYEAYQEGGGVRVDVDTYELGTVFSFGLKRSF